MQTFYLNTVQNTWFNALGEEFQDGMPSVAFQSREDIRIITVTDSPNAGTENVNPADDWPRDTQWAGYNSVITIDNDYLHKLKGTLSTPITAGTAVSEVTAVVPNVTAAGIPASGTLRLFDDFGNSESVHYSSRIISGANVTFIVTSSHVANKDYAAGAVIDCPQSPYCYARMDAVKSKPGEGVFDFYLVVDSERLREVMLYTSTAVLDIQGLELLFYAETEHGTEPVRAFLLSTFSVTGTIGDADFDLELPESDALDQINQTIYSIVAAGFDVQLSADSEVWQDYDATIGSLEVWKFYRFRSKATGGEWSPAVPLVEGKKGESAYELAVAKGFEGSETEWLASLVGPTGKGMSAYEVAVAGGFKGSEDEWLASLVGPTGEGMKYDASGALADRPLYDDAPAGFTFAVAVADSKKFITTLSLYKKLSDTTGDWSPALDIVFYGSDDPEITAVLPVSFGAPPDNALYFAIDATAQPACTVCQVTIDTDMGELILPYGSDSGIKKIIRSSGYWYIYFGELCPKFESGKVYLSQMVGASKSAASEPVESTMYYGYLPSTETFQRLIDITPNMLDDNTLVATNTAALGGVVLGDIPAGTFTVVLIPKTNAYSVTKDDGFGGRVPFAVDNGFAGTGANGKIVTLGQVEYRIYGEFNLVPGYTKIYID